MHEPLLCDAALEWIDPSLDGELAAAEEARLRDHLAGCPSCAAEMDLAVKIQRELRALAPVRRGVVVPIARPARPAGAGRGLLMAAMLVLTLGGTVFLAQIRVRPAGSVQVAAKPATAEDVTRATAEARYALAYIAKVSRHTSLDLRDGILRRRLPLTSTD
jgi:anti-sigma factor RsiW